MMRFPCDVLGGKDASQLVCPRPESAKPTTSWTWRTRKRFGRSSYERRPHFDQLSADLFAHATTVHDPFQRVVRRFAFHTSKSGPRPVGYCFSHSCPLNLVMVISRIVPLSRQRALTLYPSGCERGT